MYRFKLSFFLLFVLSVTNQVVFGQMPLSQTAKFSILTCQEGDELYSFFGHTAIRIKDEVNALDVVYNYGTFDFSTKNFYLKFIKGDLRYFVSAYSYNEFYYEYTIENRSIYEQKLNLNQLQKQQLFDALNNSLLTDEKYYTYKFIDRNCTNMVVDKVNHTLGQNCIVKTTEKDKSYRQILFPYSKNHFYENLGMNILFGKKVDDNGEKLFLPNQFMASLTKAKYNGKYIAESPKTILKALPSEHSKSVWNTIYTFCLILFLIVITRRSWVYLSYFAVIGLLGVFLVFIGVYTSHQELKYNYNILLFNPLLLVLIVSYWRKNFVWVKRISQISIILVVALFLILLNKPNLIMFLPMIISLLIPLFYFLRKSKRVLLSSIK